MIESQNFLKNNNTQKTLIAWYLSINQYTTDNLIFNNLTRNEIF